MDTIDMLRGFAMVGIGSTLDVTRPGRLKTLPLLDFEQTEYVGNDTCYFVVGDKRYVLHVSEAE